MKLGRELRVPLVADGIVVVDQRQNFHLRLFALEERHDLFVHRTRLSLVVHQVEQHVLFGDRLQACHQRSARAATRGRARSICG